MVYADPPWVFRGRALYQLQLVKADEARKYVPEGFHLVSLFGYTLGGFYLARYTNSPVGSFDELVALAGLIWNFPTSCAWAARVYVNNWEAREHGRQHVGLPSRFASFSEQRQKGDSERRTWWQEPTPAAEARSQGTQASSTGGCTVAVTNLERRPWWQAWQPARGRQPEPVCSLALPPPSRGWPGPRIKMVLPSFSGGTPEHPALLRYGVNLHTNVNLVKPAWVAAAGPRNGTDEEALGLVLGGRTVLALAFENMLMSVDEPAPWMLSKRHGASTKHSTPVALPAA